MRTAIGRRGVAVVVVPGDVALASLDATPPAFIAAPKPLLRPSEHDLRRLASLLNDAGAVTLLCGAGCAGAHAEVTALAKLLKAPIVHPLRGKEHVEGALTAALRHDGPALVDVLTARQELVLPPKTTFGQAYAFNLFLLKAVMNGRADQLIDLAKVNLWR